MDAGVPVKAPVSGIAMGLIKEGDKVVILSDILGDEDHLGDMDFKVVGTRHGVTSLQMDIKIAGVDKAIMAAALEQAKTGRIHILGEMEKGISQAREEVAEHAPKYFVHKINPDKIRDLIGPGGKVIKELSAEYDAKIEVDDSGLVKMFTINARWPRPSSTGYVRSPPRSKSARSTREWSRRSRISVPSSRSCPVLTA